MPKIEIDVRKHPRHLQSGKITSVKKHTRTIQQKQLLVKNPIEFKQKKKLMKSESTELSSVTYRKKKAKIKASDIFNEKTKANFKEIVDIFQKYPDYNQELGFGISKDGRTTDLIFGETNEIAVGGKSFSEFGENLAFTVHTHPSLVEEGDYNISERYFTDSDLLMSDLFHCTPVLLYREQFYDENRKLKVRYMMKSLTDVPKDREVIVREYGGIREDYHTSFQKWKDKHNISTGIDYLSLPPKQYDLAEKDLIEIKKVAISRFKQKEKEYGVLEKQLYVRKYPKKKERI